MHYGVGVLRGALGVGRFLRKRRVCGAGPLGDRSLPRRSSGDSSGCSWIGDHPSHPGTRVGAAEDTAQKAQGGVCSDGLSSRTLESSRRPIPGRYQNSRPPSCPEHPTRGDKPGARGEQRADAEMKEADDPGLVQRAVTPDLQLVGRIARPEQLHTGNDRQSLKPEVGFFRSHQDRLNDKTRGNTASPQGSQAIDSLGNLRTDGCAVANSSESTGFTPLLRLCLAAKTKFPCFSQELTPTTGRPQ